VQNVGVGSRGVARNRDRRGSRAEVDRGGDRTGSGSVVRGVDVGRGAEVAQHAGVDGDLHLLGGILRPDVHQIDVRLHFHHVVKGDVEVLAVVDLQNDQVAGRTLNRQVLVDLVVRDDDRRAGTDVDRVAEILDLTLIVGVRNRSQHGRGVELLDQLARPNLRYEDTAIGRARVLTNPRVGRNRIYSAHVRKLLSQKSCYGRTRPVFCARKISFSIACLSASLPR